MSNKLSASVTTLLMGLTSFTRLVHRLWGIAVIISDLLKYDSQLLTKVEHLLSTLAEYK